MSWETGGALHTACSLGTCRKRAAWQLATPGAAWLKQFGSRSAGALPLPLACWASLPL